MVTTERADKTTQGWHGGNAGTSGKTLPEDRIHSRLLWKAQWITGFSAHRWSTGRNLAPGTFHSASETSAICVLTLATSVLQVCDRPHLWGR